MTRPCGHPDAYDNSVRLEFPVTLKRDSDDDIVLSVKPDYVLKRRYCLECLLEGFDRLVRPPWWKRLLRYLW